MKAKKNRLFTILVVAVYALTVLALGITLFVEYQNGVPRAEKRFLQLYHDANRNMRTNEIGSKDFIAALEHSIGDKSDIAGIQFVYNGNPIYTYPEDIVNSKVTLSPFVYTNHEKLTAQDGLPVTLIAAVYKLSPDSIYYKGRAAFITLLITTLVCIFYLAYLYLAGKNPQTPKEKKTADRSEEPETIESYDELFNSQEADSHNSYSASGREPEIHEEEAKPAPVKENKSIWDDELPDLDEDFYEDSGTAQENAAEAIWTQPETDESLDEKEEDYSAPLTSNITQEEYQALTKDLLPEKTASKPQAETDFFSEPTVAEESAGQDSQAPDPAAKSLEEELAEQEYQAPAAKEPVIDETVLSMPEPSPAAEQALPDAPQGLFSPDTGFGWEDYMLTRLDSELMRAASTEQDLALFTLRILKIDWSEQVAKEIASKIIERFKFADLVFEYQDDGCSAMCQGLTIEKAIEFAEDLRTDIIAILAKYNLYNTVAVGISTRSFRLISGERLANESQQALVHALEDKESPIVAFKANPEKYRRYLAEEVAKTKPADETEEA